MQIAILVQEAFIASPKPSVLEGARVCLIIILVSREYTRSANDDLASFVDSQMVSMSVDNTHLHAARHPHGSRFVRSRGQRIRRHLMRRFRHAVSFQERYSKQFLHLMYPFAC